MLIFRCVFDFVFGFFIVSPAWGNNLLPKTFRILNYIWCGDLAVFFPKKSWLFCWREKTQIQGCWFWETSRRRSVPSWISIALIFRAKCNNPEILPPSTFHKTSPEVGIPKKIPRKILALAESKKSRPTFSAKKGPHHIPNLTSRPPGSHPKGSEVRPWEALCSRASAKPSQVSPGPSTCTSQRTRQGEKKTEIRGFAAFFLGGTMKNPGW